MERLTAFYLNTIVVAAMLMAGNARAGNAQSGVNPGRQTPTGGATAQPSTAVAAPALAALGAIGSKEWLTQPSRVLLERVLRASSKSALDEAAKSDPRAQALAGTGYYLGVSGYPQSDPDAERLYRLAARTNPIAQVNLGVMIENGRVKTGNLPPLGVAASFYRQAALQGHAVAQTNLGIMYQQGRGVDRDNTQAVDWLSRAAAQGVGRAQWELSRHYRQGLGVEKNEARAQRFTQLAADQGVADALNQLAYEEWLYSTFIGMTDEKAEAASKAKADALYVKAFAAYQRDAAAGSATATTALGDYYRMGQGTVKDSRTAYASYKKAVELGDLDALLDMGEMTEQGEGVPKDEAEAARLYRRSADNGSLRAQTYLARMVETGRGGFKADKAEAIRLYKELAQKGDEEAQEDLKRLGQTTTATAGAQQNSTSTGAALLVKEGQDLVKAGNPKSGMQKFLEASAQGSSDADCEIGVLYFRGSGVDKSNNEALYWFERAAQGGNVTAMSLAGVQYYSGLGIAVNYAKAAQWLPRPAEAGYVGAQYYLALMYRDGQGVSRDSKKAFDLLTKITGSNNEMLKYAWSALAALYLTGEGVEKSALNAYVRATLAVDRGVTEAVATRDAAARQLTPAQIAQAQVEIERDKARRH